MKVAAVTLLALAPGFCGAADAAVTLRQDFENRPVGAAGFLGDPNDTGGRFGPMHPHPESPALLNRLADTTDTAMQDGNHAMAIVCGASGSAFGKREHWRIVRSAPLSGPDNAFALSLLLNRGEGGAVVVTLAEDDSSGGPSFLVAASGRVGHGGAGGWQYKATMPTGVWWQFRFFVDQAERTYALHYRTSAASDWVEIGAEIGYEGDRSFNTLDLFPHFGAETLPSHVYVDAIEAVSVAEPERIRERDRLRERRLRAEEERTRRASEYWGPRRRAAGEYGEVLTHTSMPPLPEDPEDYANMWDPFVPREPGTGDGFEIAAQSGSGDRVMSAFDRLPWNGRQLLRDAQGRWLVLIEQEPGKIHLAWGPGAADNPYRPRGGDLEAVALLADGNSALLPGHGTAHRAGMAIDGGDRLHVVWHEPDGLWHAAARMGADGPATLRERRSWSEPERLTAGACRAGDIMRDADGRVLVSYSQGDTVYVRPVSGGEAETAGGLGAGMPEMASRGGRIPVSERECQDAVTDLAPDGSIWLAFRRDFNIWVARRTREGEWEPAARVAREYVFHPSIMVVGGRPLVAFLHEGLRMAPLDVGGDLGKRSGGGAAIGYATLTENGWRTGAIVSAEEIPVLRRGMWSFRNKGRVYSQIEQLGWPVLFRDPQGVVWALWQNTTRRWACSARWLDEAFGQVQECRGPFNAPCLPVNAEKHAPPGAGDVGVLFCAAAAGGENRPIFDRLRIPSLSADEDREVLFLDSLELAATEGAEFVLNPMTKPSPGPALSPRGEKLTVWGPQVTKRGDLYVMRYSSPEGGHDHGEPRYGLAVSRDGLHFEMVEELPEGLPEPEETPTRPLDFWNGRADTRARECYDNPDLSDPARTFMRLCYSRDNRGTYWVEYSADQTTWTGRTDTTAVASMREGGRPSVYLAEDPERPIRIYSRVYTETGRSWGVIWSRDLVHWGGMEHLLDVDDPYGTKPTSNEIGDTGNQYTMRGQVYLDSVAGKNEYEIYASQVCVAEGLFFAFYWPGCQGRPLADVGIAVSRDGFNFTRVKNGERVLPLGPPGAWDSGYIFQMSPMLDGDTVRVYYRGTAGRREGTDGFGHNLTEIGLATIRVNGFTYYTPRVGRDHATITTIPIAVPAARPRALAVNIEGAAGRNGAFAVEVLDADTGEPLPGFSLAQCRAPTTDGIAVPITWQAGDTLPTGRDIRLRFRLGAAGVRLYSFGFRDAEREGAR